MPIKTKQPPLSAPPPGETTVTGAMLYSTARDIMHKEGIDYSDQELTEVLQFIAKVIDITTGHYERIKERETKLNAIHTNKTHETKSLPLHPCKYRRAS